MVKSNQTYTAILSAAHQLFLNQGYNNTSIADIAQACNLSKASLYHHIINKEALLSDIIKRAHEQLTTDVFTQVLTRKEDAQNALLHLCDLLNQPCNKNTAFLLLRLHVELKTANNPPAQLLVHHFNDWENMLEKIFSEQVSVTAQRDRIDNTLSLLHGAITFSVVRNDVKNLDHAKTLICRLAS